MSGLMLALSVWGVLACILVGLVIYRVFWATMRKTNSSWIVRRPHWSRSHSKWCAGSTAWPQQFGGSGPRGRFARAHFRLVDVQRPVRDAHRVLGTTTRAPCFIVALAGSESLNVPFSSGCGVFLFSNPIRFGYPS